MNRSMLGKRKTWTTVGLDQEEERIVAHMRAVHRCSKSAAVRLLIRTAGEDIELPSSPEENPDEH